MSEADGNSFEYNKRHGLIWRDTEGTYHPVVTEAECANCGAIDDVDNMIAAEDMFFCSMDCKRLFTGEDVL